MSGYAPRAHQLLRQGLDALADAVGPACEDGELISTLTVVEGASRRLDRIVVGPGLHVAETGVHASLNARTASDHLPVWAELKLQ